MIPRSALLFCAVCVTLPIAVAAAPLPGPVPREKEPPAQARMREQRFSLTVTGCGGLQGNVRQPVRFRVAGVRHLHDACSRL